MLAAAQPGENRRVGVGEARDRSPAMSAGNANPRSLGGKPEASRPSMTNSPIWANHPNPFAKPRGGQAVRQHRVAEHYRWRQYPASRRRGLCMGGDPATAASAPAAGNS